MIVVTGGAGFIGSNLVKGLNQQRMNNIVIVDDLKNGHKFHNLVDLNFYDYIDKDEFVQQILEDSLPWPVTAIFHQGACSDTTEWDGKYLLDENYAYSKHMLHFCRRHKVPMIYASSASVYGLGPEFSENEAYEKPLNMYAFSKFRFDKYVAQTQQADDPQIIGLRYFNVYGPRESHKNHMASVAFHLNNQLKEGDVIRLFGEYEGYAAGEQMRDFVHVDDVVSVNLWFLEHPEVSGVFNVGTGYAQTFNEVAEAVISFYQRGEIQYIPLPEKLKGAYQSYTQADITKLRDAGYTQTFMPVEEGVRKYMEWLNPKEKLAMLVEVTCEE